MRKKSIVISVLCLSLSLPGGALAGTNGAVIPQSIKVESQVKAAVDSTSIGALAEDLFGPVLESATVNPTTAAVGETITITAQVSDDLSGVAAVDAYLNLPNGTGYKVLPLELDTATGEWKGTYTITELDLEGTWIIDFDLFDAAGNYTYALPAEPIEVQVVNPNGGDAEAPTLESRTITPLAVGVNEEVTIRTKVNDANGVASVFAAIYTADSTGYHYVPLTLDEATGEWVGSHIFSESDQPGSWYIDIDMFDKAGNFDWVTLEEKLVLTNPLSDYTSPAIGTPVISPKTAAPGESVRVSVPVSDDKSGVRSVYAEFSHIDHPNDIYLRHMTLDPNTGEWVADLNIESGFQSGVWNVVIHSTDKAGNSGYKEHPAAFDVINNDGDFDAPVISNVQVTQGEVKVGETVTVTANVTDNVAVDSVFATFYSQEGSQFVEMNYNEENDQWTGSFVVQETTAPGFYQVSVAAYDPSFNFNFGDAEGGFTVVNLEGDYTGPVISAVELDKTEVNIGEQVTIFAMVEDAESGVANVTAYYNGNESINLTYDNNLQKWIGTITVPTDVPDGEVITIDFINALDLSGNQSVAFFNDVSFVVRDPNADSTPPVNPVVAEVSDQSTEVSGTTEAGASVTVSIGSEIYTGTADESGNFTIAIPVQSEGTVITVSAKDASDNVSEETRVTVVDKTAPANPVVTEVNDQSTAVSGTTEAGASVTVSIGSETYSGTADESGNFTIAIPVQAAGTVITVSAKDAGDNVSEVTTVTVVDKTPPAAPIVDAITDKTTSVNGITEGNAEVTVKIGDTVIGSGKADAEGKFSITIAAQASGTTIAVIAKDEAGNESTTEVETALSYQARKIQLNGVDFAEGYIANSHTHLNWKALDALKILHSNKGNGVFEIEGRTVQALSINGDWYIAWHELSPGRLIYERISGGYNFIYTTPVKVRLNGNDFSQGGYIYKNGTHVNWNALKILNIPYTDKGNGLFVIEGRNVQAVLINKDWYIPYSLLSPGKIIYERFSGGYNFIYTTPVRVQLNGNDFIQGGYRFNNGTYVNWNALKILNTPFTDKGKGLFAIEGRNVQAVSVNGDWYIPYSYLSSGIRYERISGGYNFIITPPIKVQLNGNDFAQGGYRINNGAYVNWNALKALNIPYTDKGKGLFQIEGRDVQAVLVKGDWYIAYSKLSPGKITYQRISGGYNFIYNQ
ncbi:Ig-like domain-containing protein [Neobacillus sp. DY30]|uniref:Ig-like domain-containing protein n=1 Tax=Neobacillus sp. DY30 TaxID=3047871 RepID=UPI0024C02494|nr:Ig-like domain-containing protein [Neobacillus sp. DY30]WHY00450.1 Ig-like domain-containing protein [Neobacillus sp. DY30]